MPTLLLAASTFRRPMRADQRARLWRASTPSCAANIACSLFAPAGREDDIAC
jgi:hypothetical protein